MFERPQKTLFAALIASTLCACAAETSEGTKKGAREQGQPLRTERASEQIDGYDGKAKVVKVGPQAVRPVAISNGAGRRTLVYIAKESTKYLQLRRAERAKRKNRVMRSFVLTDSSAQAFRRNFKKTHPSIPAGSVTSLNANQVDDLLARLDQLGFNRLPLVTGNLGDPIPKQRAMHLDIGGVRKSVYRDQVRPSASGESSKAVYFRCEIFLVNYFQTIQLGKD